MLSEKLPGAMSKLSYGDVREIIRRSDKGDISDHHLSRVYNVSPQWIREIKRRARLGIPLPGESPLGRPRRPAPPDGRYGFPRQLLTDNGTQFTKTSYGGEGYFDQKLRELERTTGIKVEHIKSGVKHPQTGGKIERAIGTIKSKLRARWPDGEKQFDSLEEIITWYNTDRPHMSLRLEVGETPMMAFIRKLRPRERRVYLRNHPEVWSPELSSSR
ncbi:MAG: integrase core domain-containing protein [Thermoplasmata archaeon]